MWTEVTKKHGPIHILINNAAICLGKRVEDLNIN